jgi:hypothetical protein
MKYPDDWSIQIASGEPHVAHAKESKSGMKIGVLTRLLRCPQPMGVGSWATAAADWGGFKRLLQWGARLN